ncbi:ferrous iron transporter A (plasmid) [Borrelia miyamotoi]|uniref:Ferrous iron transporter A n=1 Tax=Borrelia miyamotoi TaxID=47466 RepID=A0A5P8AUU9_9SPIR|nr:ferrous iron transporter A [Borrelia miyamotoi]QFP42480.1 ferrous iron transporter A [Borrelia miyamotoi]WAZ72879.1 ferrous iron transporter A [Borrelia miyamotoi]WVI05708.1 ferrous iron transporter A [Borrelia miyamotoi]
MRVKSKYLAVGLLFSFISCDLFMSDEMKDKSLGLFDKVNSILDASEKSVRKTTKKKRKTSRKRSSSVKRYANSNLVQNVMSDDITSGLQDDIQHSNIQTDAPFEHSLEINDEENSKVELSSTKSELREKEIQKQQDEHSRVTQGSLTYPLSSESGELKETIESNEINFTIDYDFRAKNDLQTISGSNTISYASEIEEEDYEQYYLEDEEDEYDEEEIRLDNRYKSYLGGVGYNVSAAIGTIDKIYNNYKLFEEQRTKMYSTRLDTVTKDQAKKEAEKFTKEELEKALKELLNYIQVSAKIATNFVYQKEQYAKQRLDKLETEVKTLISEVQGQSHPYEAYKAIVRSKFLQMKDSLEVVKGVIDRDGPWY